ncbi:28781_t:CDS:2, partial [Racocetra persica]
LYNPLSSDDGVTDFKIGAIWSMKFSKDGKFLATGGQDTVVRVWAVISSDEEREHFLEGSGTSVYEGISGAKLGAPVFRDKPLYEYRGHTADILDLSWKQLLTFFINGQDREHTDFVTAIEFHPKDDRFFLSGSLDCRLRLWNIPEKRVSSWNELNDSQLITAVGFALDGKIAVAGSLSGKCLFYETDGLKYNTQIHVKSARGRNSQGKKITGIESMPGTLPGQEKLLISSNDSRIRLYNMRDKSLECKFKGLENTSSQIRATFSDDGRYIICGSEDRHVYIFNTDQSSINSSHGNGSNWLKKEKCGYENFESHSAIVTVAIFAPTRTKQLISLCGDPIFAHTVNNENTANQTYPDGNIIVCADYTGSIKIFRQDCAYYPSRDSDSVSFRSTRKVYLKINKISLIMWNLYEIFP